MEEIEVEMQEFDGNDYILCKTINYNNSDFDVYSNINDSNDIRVYKQIVEDSKTYYEKATNEEYLFVLSKCA